MAVAAGAVEDRLTLRLERAGRENRLCRNGKARLVGREVVQDGRRRSSRDLAVVEERTKRLVLEHVDATVSWKPPVRFGSRSHAGCVGVIGSPSGPVLATLRTLGTERHTSVSVRSVEAAIGSNQPDRRSDAGGADGTAVGCAGASVGKARRGQRERNADLRVLGEVAEVARSGAIRAEVVGIDRPEERIGCPAQVCGVTSLSVGRRKLERVRLDVARRASAAVTTKGRVHRGTFESCSISTTSLTRNSCCRRRPGAKSQCPTRPVSSTMTARQPRRPSGILVPV